MMGSSNRYTAIGLSLENARLDIVNKKGNAIEDIENSKKALEDAIADIRAYILDLRPRQLRHSNLLDGMKSLIREFRANTMIEVELSGSAEEVEGLAKPQLDALYHIFQESISNTAKHARASKVSVRLWRMNDRVFLRVKDDGMGFEEAKTTRRGWPWIGKYAGARGRCWRRAGSYLHPPAGDHADSLDTIYPYGGHPCLTITTPEIWRKRQSAVNPLPCGAPARNVGLGHDPRTWRRQH